MFQFKNKKHKNVWFFVETEQRKNEIKFRIEKSRYLPDAPDDADDLISEEIIYLNVAEFAAWHAKRIKEGWTLCKE